MLDVVIIGAGIIGTAIARELSRYQLNIVVVEKDSDVACGATKANSALIHAGFDAPYDSLRGKTNVRGNFLYEEITKELNVPFRRNGAMVLAFTEEEIKTIKDLKANGEKLGIKDLEIINGKQIKIFEPNIKNEPMAALYAPSAGLINPWEMAIAFMENAMENGVELKCNYHVKKIGLIKGGFLLGSKDEEFLETKYIINAAGVYADEVYGLIGKPNFKITPRRGEYYLLDEKAYGLVHKTLFRCPTEKGKGMVVSPTIDGNVLIGPTAHDLDDSKKSCTATSLQGLLEIKKLVNDLINKISLEQNITNYAGVRAEPDGGEFIIEESDVEGFINVAGIKSPGLSAAPAIAERVRDLIMTSGLKTKKKKNFKNRRESQISLKNLSLMERNQLIKANPDYGQIICRCEKISKGEIIDAIKRTCGAKSVNGVKRRARPGAGRCQGGFCSPKVVKILREELNIGIEKVLLENKGSNVIVGETKGDVYEEN